MHKPKITRLTQDPYFPQKDFMSKEDVIKYFVNREIIIMEKFDGKAHYDKDFKILLEDLQHRGKDHLIKYHSNRWMILAIFNERTDEWFPLVDEWYEIVLDYFNEKEFVDKIYERYRKYQHHAPLFRGILRTYEDLIEAVRIYKYQKSQWLNNRNGKMEGIVIFSVDDAVWAKSHNEWFSKELSEIEEVK
jgi:hypothetical protein